MRETCNRLTFLWFRAPLCSLFPSKKSYYVKRVSVHGHSTQILKLGYWNHRFKSNEPVSCLSVTPDCRHVVCGGSDGVIRVWGTYEGSEHQEFKGHEGVWRLYTFKYFRKRRTSKKHSAFHFILECQISFDNSSLSIFWLSNHTQSNWGRGFGEIKRIIIHSKYFHVFDWSKSIS